MMPMMMAAVVGVSGAGVVVLRRRQAQMADGMHDVAGEVVRQISRDGHGEQAEPRADPDTPPPRFPPHARHSRPRRPADKGALTGM